MRSFLASQICFSMHRDSLLLLQVIVAREQNASAEDSGSSDEDESEDEQAASGAEPSSATHEKVHTLQGQSWTHLSR